MCGAFGGPPPDPAGRPVAGPLRRSAIARAVDEVCPALTVRAVPGGWTAATGTGRTTVCRTLDALVTAVAPHVVRSPRYRGTDPDAAEAVRAVRAELVIFMATTG